MSLTLGYVFCALATLVIIARDDFIKRAANQGLTFGAPKVLLVCALYAVSAALWFAAMHHITLAVGALILMSHRA
jgi:undecaprenyl phosphate-alpha-L-ara4N flippase subunit ArnF